MEATSDFSERNASGFWAKFGDKGTGNPPIGQGKLVDLYRWSVDGSEMEVARPIQLGHELIVGPNPGHRSVTREQK